MDNNLPDLSTFNKGWGWLLFWGLLLIVLGFLAISATFFTTILTVIFLGVLLLIGGAVVLIDSFTTWWGRWREFALHLIMGILYLVLGGLIIKSPILGSISLTLWLGIFYIVLGIFRCFYSFSSQRPRWGWALLSGLIALLLGILIVANWPTSGLYVIGLFIGIDLIFYGWAYVMIALYARTVQPHHTGTLRP